MSANCVLFNVRGTDYSVRMVGGLGEILQLANSWARWIIRSSLTQPHLNISIALGKVLTTQHLEIADHLTYAERSALFMRNKTN